MIEMAPEAQGRAGKAAKLSRTRHTGMDAEGRERLAKALSALSDWWGICRHCGEKLEGTLAAIKEHDCGAAGR